jgi:hypothetical protein
MVRTCGREQIHELDIASESAKNTLRMDGLL